MLDIIIPVFNQEVLVIKALDSIPKRKDIRIIIVDDCSTDNTYANIENWILNNKDFFNDIILIKNDINLGVGKSMAKAYEISDNEYLYVLDSDDYLLTDRFNDLLNSLDKYKNYDVIRIDNEINDGTIEHGKHTSGWSYILRNRFKIKYPELRKAGDWLYWEEIRKLGAKFVESNCMCYHYNYPRKGSIVWNYKQNKTDWKGDPI